MFKVGDRVIHNSYGLCKIRTTEIIDDTDYGEQEYYIIYIEKTKIMIPVAYAGALRYPIKKEEVPKVLETLEIFQELPDDISSGEAIDIYADKAVSNNILEVAECLRDLTVLNEKNALRGAVKNMLGSINKILIEEISFVQNISKVRAQKLINDRLNKAAERAKCNRKK